VRCKPINSYEGRSYGKEKLLATRDQGLPGRSGSIVLLGTRALRFLTVFTHLGGC